MLDLAVYRGSALQRRAERLTRAPTCSLIVAIEVCQAHIRRPVDQGHDNIQQITESDARRKLLVSRPPQCWLKCEVLQPKAERLLPVDVGQKRCQLQQTPPLSAPARPVPRAVAAAEAVSRRESKATWSFEVSSLGPAHERMEHGFACAQLAACRQRNQPNEGARDPPTKTSYAQPTRAEDSENSARRKSSLS